MEQNVLNEERLNGCTLRVSEDGNKTVEMPLDVIQDLNECVSELNGIQTMQAIADITEYPDDEELRNEARRQFLRFYRSVCQVAHDVRKLVPDEWIYGERPETNMGF